MSFLFWCGLDGPINSQRRQSQRRHRQTSPRRLDSERLRQASRERRERSFRCADRFLARFGILRVKLGTVGASREAAYTLRYDI